MTLVIWNPAWETGINSIDEQHRQLLTLFDSLLTAIQEHHAEEPVPGILAFLSGYVETHFSEEERQMQLSHYPGFVGHKAIHDEMRTRVAYIAKMYRENPATMTEEVINFLTEWLIGHINGHDLRMARHLIQFNTRDSRAEP